ncbi:hypothetical protein EC968_002872 [Mortierella alpina]|nr:hypothetical protein EC968_002872 [Mortierella alpina]
MINVLAVILAILVSLYYRYRSHAPGAHPRPDLKEPKGAVPLLGHLLVLASYPGVKLYDFLEKQNKELGPVWSISLPFFGRIVLAHEPRIIEHVLKTNFPNYVKGEILAGVLEDIIGKVDGEEWRSIRKLMFRAFNIKAFHEYTSDVFVIQGKKVIDYLRKAADEGFIVDIHDLIHLHIGFLFGIGEGRKGIRQSVAKALIQEVDQVLRGVDPAFTTQKQQKYAEACFYEGKITDQPSSFGLFYAQQHILK